MQRTWTVTSQKKIHKRPIRRWKLCSTSLVITEIQIETAYYIPSCRATMEIINTTRSQGYGSSGFHLFIWLQISLQKFFNAAQNSTMISSWIPEVTVIWVPEHLHSLLRNMKNNFLIFFRFYWHFKSYIYIYSTVEPRDPVTHTCIHIVGLQCCINFCYTAKWFSYTYTHIHSHINYHRILSRFPCAIEKVPIDHPFHKQ